MADPVSVNAAPIVDSGAVPTPAVDEQPGHKVFTGNLAYTTTDEGLKSFFAPVAEDILSAQVIFRGTRSAGYGFVAFNTAEAAQKAVELLNKKELDGRTLIVEVAKPTEEKAKEKKEKRTPKKRSSKKAKSATDEAAPNGTTEPTETKDSADKGETNGDAKPKKKRNTRKTKKAKAEAKEGDAATTTDAAAAATPAAAAAEPRPKKVKTPKAKPAKPVRPIGETPEGEPSKTMLFVANLGFTVDDAALSELFTSAGITVVTARVVRRRWGQPRRSKGYGFVDVGSEEEQKKALELLQGKEVGGREIAVKIAVNAQEHEADDGEAAPAHDTPGLIAAAS